MGFGFNPFGDHRQIERAGHGDNRPQHGQIARVARPLDHRAVKLEVMQREQLEVAEVAEACAEIVERDPHSPRGQAFQRQRSLGHIGQQHLFGHFQRQPFGRKAAGRNQIGEFAGETAMGQIVRCDVQRQPQVIGPALRPGQRGLGDVARQLGDMIGPLGNREQCTGADPAEPGVVPAGERLSPAKAVIRAGPLRLVDHFDLAQVDRAQQIGLELGGAAPGADCFTVGPAEPAGRCGHHAGQSLAEPVEQRIRVLPAQRA